MCNCIENVNKLLAENNNNTQIMTPSILNGSLENVSLNRTLVLVEKVDPSKRTKLLEIAADFCPFCGVAAV